MAAKSQQEVSPEIMMAANKILSSEKESFLNYYKCPRCKHRWEDLWASMCDDQCPQCHLKGISPYQSLPARHTRCSVCEIPLSNKVDHDKVLTCKRKQCPNEPVARDLKQLAAIFPEFIGKLIDKDLLR